MPSGTRNPIPNSASTAPHVEIAVVGTGPAGLLAALSLARLGFDTALVGPPPNLEVSGQNARTAALFPTSIDFLEQLGIWEHCEELCEPLRAIRIIDDLDAVILRAPEVLFEASEIDAPTFGFNVPNDVLVCALWQGLENLVRKGDPQQRYRFVATSAVKGVDLAGEIATLTLGDGQNLSTKLVVAADGRNSVCRTSARLETQTWSYPQTALTCVLTHSKPHHGISTELHRQSGPCTTVPMTSNTSGHRSSLVWMETSKTAERLLNLSDDAFRRSLEHRLRGHLGTVTDVSPRAAFPLSGLSVPVAGANRVALVGEAAHVMPPIGAQGLNLGFRDVMQLAECLTSSPHQTNDPGHRDILASYARARKPDITARIWGVDLLNRSLLAGGGPVHLARGAGLAALKAFPALRRHVIHQGLNPHGPAPKLDFLSHEPA